MLSVNNPKISNSCGALDQVNDATDTLRTASEPWDEAGPRLIEQMSKFASDPRSMTEADAFYAVHLFGEKGDVRAYPVLCKLIAEDRQIADWLDDAVTETLPGVLIKVFDGNAALLRQAIESSNGDVFARASALAALAYLVRARGAMRDADMRAFLRRIRIEMPPRHESILWMTWAQVVADLGYKSMRSEVAALNRDGFIPGGDFSVAEFVLRTQLAHSDPSGLAGFARDRIGPFDCAASAVLWIAGQSGNRAVGACRMSCAKVIEHEDRFVAKCTKPSLSAEGAPSGSHEASGPLPRAFSNSSAELSSFRGSGGAARDDDEEDETTD